MAFSASQYPEWARILSKHEKLVYYCTTRAMSTYKFYYFNARGYGEVSRIIFAQADVKYEDIRFEGDQFKKEYKDSKISVYY